MASMRCTVRFDGFNGILSLHKSLPMYKGRMMTRQIIKLDYV